MKNNTSYLSPKVFAQPHPDKGGWGIFAREVLQSGEVLIVWGGAIYTGVELKNLPEERRIHSVQVEEDLYLLGGPELEPGDLINHCCEPNAGLSGQITIVALREICAGEEVCFDYAMTDGSPYDEFECACGSAMCRGKVTGDDWRQPVLWERYAGYFSPYLQRRIDNLRVQM